MRYYNNLTTPSGKYCTLNELTNREYLILLKFLQGDNFKGFFENIDLKIKETIEDFDDYNIVDKCYVYLALCAYCVKGNIMVMNNKIGDQEISIITLLDNVEKSYKEKELKFKLNEKITITFGIPKTFYVDESNNIVIDYLSNIKNVNGLKPTKNDISRLMNILSTRQKSLIENFIQENLQDKFNILDGVPLNKLELPLYSFPFILNVANIFKLNLKSFYDVLYMMCHHVKMTYEGFMNLTFIEADIILKTCISEKSKEAEQMNNSMN